MPAAHIPLLVLVMCASHRCDNMTVIQDLIRSNLGPLLGVSGYIGCSRVHTGLVECDVYTPWKTSCVCCRQLTDTFTSEVVADMLGAAVEDVEITCELPARYLGCATPG